MTFPSGRCAGSALAEMHRQIEYKAKWYNASVYRIERFYPSSKLCSSCGHKQDIGFKRTWKCSGCGVTHDRDLNAAINIVRRGMRRLEEAPGV